MSTPSDLTIAELQPDDVPYAGALGVHSSWASYDNERLTALQLYVGATSGEVFGSGDAGATWSTAALRLPPVYSVAASGSA